jgi:glycosyltransferase involved in cell wall biosynthesis
MASPFPVCPGDATPIVSVLMPTFRHEAFIAGAIGSLLAQTEDRWELIVIDDGSPDDTALVLREFSSDPRIRSIRLPRNVGLGRALNVGLQAACASLIAYLPSDDLWHADHLASLLASFDEHPGAALVYSGVRYQYNRHAEGQIPGEPLQLVQVLHLRTPDRWIERSELTTDDLDRMFWDRIRARGRAIGTGVVTCEWVDHPRQRHKLLREPEGGINRYRQYCGAADPLRVHTSVGNRIDEPARYATLRARDIPPRPDGLKIVLAGELAYNADRVLALAERGHRLYGLWMPDPHWYNSVGPLPFGHVEDLPRDGWHSALHRLQPDVIHAQLNWQAVPFALEVRRAAPDIPFVWHFKEGPFICREKGTWDDLIALVRTADGLIHSSAEMGDWFDTIVPQRPGQPQLILDGDLPRREWFSDVRSPRLSAATGELHTVVPGRPIGLHPETVAELASHGIHLHVYGDYVQGQWVRWIERTLMLAGRFLHMHPHVDQDRWVEEFSQYDAGWLHAFESANCGDIRAADWDDLNIPARMATLAVAGLPMIQRDNTGAVVATQALARSLGISLFSRDIPDLAAQMRAPGHLDAIAAETWRHRERFTFDAHVERLIDFYRDVIRTTRKNRRSSLPAVAD